MLSLFGCSVNKYEIDYCGAKSSYQGAKSSYEPGVEVKLYYKNFASDMEYSFYLDGDIFRWSLTPRERLSALLCRNMM